jgi:hypothetical protein
MRRFISLLLGIFALVIVVGLYHHIAIADCLYKYPIGTQCDSSGIPSPWPGPCSNETTATGCGSHSELVIEWNNYTLGDDYEKLLYIVEDTEAHQACYEYVCCKTNYIVDNDLFTHFGWCSSGDPASDICDGPYYAPYVYYSYDTCY